jgi:hypothetical protein
MIHTFRTCGVNEIPIVAKVELLLVLKRPTNHRSPWNYVITDQTLLSEEYIPATTPPQTADPGSIPESAGKTQKTPSFSVKIRSKKSRSVYGAGLIFSLIIK